MLTSVKRRQIILFQRCFTGAGKIFLLLKGSLQSFQISTCVTSVSFLQWGIRMVLYSLPTPMKSSYFAFLRLMCCTDYQRAASRQQLTFLWHVFKFCVLSFLRLSVPAERVVSAFCFYGVRKHAHPPKRNNGRIGLVRGCWAGMFPYPAVRHYSSITLETKNLSTCIVMSNWFGFFFLEILIKF